MVSPGANRTPAPPSDACGARLRWLGHMEHKMSMIECLSEEIVMLLVQESKVGVGRRGMNV